MKTKKPTYLTYDLIRQNKFRSPEKISTVENLLKTNDCVINWWCRQSGKSLTSIKVARDLAVKQKSTIIFVAVKADNSNDLKTKMSRCIDRNLVKSDNGISITLTNGSYIRFTSSNPQANIDNADLVIFDEFDYMKPDNFSGMVSYIKNIKDPSIFQRFKNMFSFKKKTISKVIFASSMNNRTNLETIRKAFPTAPITYLNYEKVNYGPGRIDRIKEMLSEKEFNTEYNSYFPQ